MIYRIALQRSTVHEAAIELGARDGMVAWTEVHSETDVFSEAEMRAAAQ